MAKIASLYLGVLFLNEVPSLSINPVEVAKNASNVLHSNLINNSKCASTKGILSIQSNPKRITREKEGCCRKIRDSSLFIGETGGFEERCVKRILGDFCGFYTEMFYTCFTPRMKCFTLLEN
jgi:hypothetical protein